VIDEKMLCAALDLVDVGMAIVGPDRRVLWCNTAYADFLARSADELAGLDFLGEGRPCHEALELEEDWDLERMTTVSGESPGGGPIDVAVRPVVPGSDHRLVVLRRGLVRPVSGRRLPDEVAQELGEYVTELTGHAADPAMLAAAPLSILMLSIAEFDSIRSVHGEEVLEEVLRQVAQALVLQKRKADIIARYRDGQFLVLAPDTPRFGASMLAERIRRSVVALDLRVRGEPLHVTVLAFAGEYRPSLDGTVREAVEKASSSLLAQALQIVS
jgi:diguanylate cyclase (GGDEF)-like protein